MKGIVSGIMGCHPDEVTSPTFTYLHIYEGNTPLYHFDLYRLSRPEEFVAMGFDEFLTAQGVCCIEWADRIRSLLPSDVKCVELVHRAPELREIRYE